MRTSLSPQDLRAFAPPDGTRGPATADRVLLERRPGVAARLRSAMTEHRRQMQASATLARQARWP